MAKTNKKEEIKIKVKIVYDNFVNKYTKKKYTLNEVIEVTDKRLEEILKLEKTSGKKLIEIIEDTSNADDTTKDIVNNENGDDNTNDAGNNNDGDGIDENENGDNDNADNQNGDDNTNNAG